MAVLYTRSTFVSSEKPSDTKLNTLDQNISDAFLRVSGVLSGAIGDDRVVDDYQIVTELECSESAVPDMNISVAAGYAIVSEAIVENPSVQVITVVTPVVSNRETLVQISNLGVISTKNSVEQAVPVVPSADANNIALCSINLPQNAPSIHDPGGAGAGEAEITDLRTFSLHPTTVKRKVSFSIPGEVSTTGGNADDGYYHSIDGGTGLQFNQAITIEEGFISSGDKPTGANLVITLHNMTQVTSDTITLSAGALCGTDKSVDLDFAAADVLGIQVTQVGSTIASSWIQLILQYVLQ